jgi:hypothetical protein
VTNVAKTDCLQQFTPSESWGSPGVLFNPYGDLEKIKIMVKIKTSAEIGINEFIELVEVAGDKTDLQIATIAADNSLTVAAYTLNSEYNRKILARDNAVDSYSGLTKSTAKFLTNSLVEAVLLFPGLVLAHKVIANAGAAGLKFMTRVQSAGSGAVDAYATAFASIGLLMGQILHVAATQWVPIMIHKGL